MRSSCIRSSADLTLAVYQRRCAQRGFVDFILGSSGAAWQLQDALRNVGEGAYERGYEHLAVLVHPAASAPARDYNWLDADGASHTHSSTRWAEVTPRGVVEVTAIAEGLSERLGSVDTQRARALAGLAAYWSTRKNALARIVAEVRLP